MARKLTRTDFNFLLDTVLLVLFVALCASSVILEFVFPAATRADGWQLWSKSYDQWSRVRFGILSLLAAAIVLHIMLHWSWVCGVVESRTKDRPTGRRPPDDPSRTLWGVALLIAIINIAGFIIGWAALTIQAP